MKKINILIIVGFVLITLGMDIQLNDLIKENEELKKANNILYDENIKLHQQNEALWDNYYMNISKYEREYYEW